MKNVKESGARSLKEGDRVKYDVGLGRKKGEIQAINVTFLQDQ